MLAITFPAIDPVLFEIGPFAIRWYALAYVAGLLLGWQYLRWVVTRPGWTLTPAAIDDLLFYATLGVLIGGRLGFVVFYQPAYYLQNPLEILFVWQGGMAFHGGLVGVVVACLVTARRHGVGPLEVGDAAAIAAPIGIFFGRIANFINAELWGRVTDAPWGMVFPGGGPLPRHPSQLYEAALEGLALFLVLAWLARGRYDAAAAGRLGGVFLVGYGAARFLVEFVREPDPQLGLLLGIVTMGQLLSLPMIALGAWLIARTKGGGEAVRGR
ncbi:MAG: prolipoprotein diacylglyceryl transferase [Geminicoccaceae bacterium]|nr:MAG: prolipoprotein diacylglyceryl transferase [Geminicoccaceae bacterium]